MKVISDVRMNEKIKKAGWGTIEILSVFVLFWVYLKTSNLGTSNVVSLGELLEGTAARPFAYRVLLPQGAKLLTKIIPFSISAKYLFPSILEDVFFQLGGALFPEETFGVLFAIFLAMLGFVYVERKFLRDLGFSKETQNILPILLLVLSLLFTVHFGYVYDIPQLFFFTISLWLLYRQEWGWYLLSFFITTLNKETSILLAVFFAFYFLSRIERKLFFRLLLSQFFLYVLVRIPLMWMYRGNQGDMVYYPTVLIHIDQYKTQPILLFVTIALFFSIYVLVRKNWTEKDAFLRAATIIPLIMIPLYIIGGMPMEFRVFLETLPILGVLLFDPKILS